MLGSPKAAFGFANTPFRGDLCPPEGEMAFRRHGLDGGEFAAVGSLPRLSLCSGRSWKTCVSEKKKKKPCVSTKASRSDGTRAWHAQLPRGHPALPVSFLRTFRGDCAPSALNPAACTRAPRPAPAQGALPRSATWEPVLVPVPPKPVDLDRAAFEQGGPPFLPEASARQDFSPSPSLGRSPTSPRNDPRCGRPRGPALFP